MKEQNRKSLLLKGNILHHTGRKQRAGCLPQQVSSSERNDRIENREAALACGFGTRPDIVKKRLISIGSHSHRERLNRAGHCLHLLKGHNLGSNTRKSWRRCSFQGPKKNDNIVLQILVSDLVACPRCDF